MITPPTLVLFAASLIVASAAAVIWRRRGVSGSKSLTFMFIAVALWCFFSGLETTAASDSQRYILATFTYIGICSVAPLFLMFAVRYSNSRWRLTGWVQLVIWSIPVVTYLLALTNGYHHLIWTGISHVPTESSTLVIWHHGPWYFAEVLWSVALCILASYHLVRVAIRAARLYVLQSILLMAGLLVPWAGYLFFFLPNNPLAGYETTCLGFAVSALLIMMAI
ncbi:MAG: histidine kinase N-terminal 7TM domain-containing protein, partial [Spirochaetia bacterium]